MELEIGDIITAPPNITGIIAQKSKKAKKLMIIWDDGIRWHKTKNIKKEIKEGLITLYKPVIPTEIF